MGLNKHFDNIYLLNLFRRKDRLNDSIGRLNQFNIKYEIFNGVDGSVMKHIWSKINNPYFTNPSYVGCSLSHLSIYQDAIDKGYTKILIIEDDNLINRNVNDIMGSVDVPIWSDLFYLGYIPLNDDCTMWDYRYGINESNIISNNIFSPLNLWGLFAYGIGIDLMREMVDLYNTSFPMEIDRYFVMDVQKRGKSIAISPQIFCCQDNQHSDNLGFSPPDMKRKSVDMRFSSLEEYI